MKICLVSDVNDIGLRLDVYISSEAENISRSRAKDLIASGAVSVDGKTAAKPAYTLCGIHSIEVDAGEPQELEAVPQDIDIDIIYQDSDLAVINKEQGMVTHPASGARDGTLVNALLYHIKDLSSINGVIRPGIVHRLDKDTSGLLVIAKNDKAHLELAKQIAQKSAKRYYLALVDGNIKNDGGIIEQPLGRSKSDRKKIAVRADGRYAKTAYKVLQRFGQYTLVEFELYTGRTHQIRVHSAYIHHPVAGDPVYGGSNSFGLNGQMLHAYKLEIMHPTTGRDLLFTADLPPYFQDVLQKLKNQASAK